MVDADETLKMLANAVVDDHAPLGKITEAQFDKMIGTNLKGVLFAVQSAEVQHGFVQMFPLPMAM